MQKRYQIDKQRAVQQFRRKAGATEGQIQLALPLPEIQPLLTSESCISNTRTRWYAQATPCHIRNVDTETLPALTIERGTRDSLLRRAGC